MDILIYFVNSSSVLTTMVKMKTDLLPNNKNFQVETIDDSAAVNAGYTGLVGVVFKKINYKLSDIMTVVQAAATQAFGNVTTTGFKLTTLDQSTGIETTLLNTKT